MHLRNGLLLATLGLFPLLGCNDSNNSTGPSNDPTQVGTVDFALPAALRAQVAGSADSLRVELRHGNALRSVSVALDSTAHVSDLDAGMWTISVGLFQLDGTLRYYGEDSVLIQPGRRSAAVVTLKPAKGSVDIVIRLDEPRSPGSLDGTWYVWSVDSMVIHDRSIPLTFGDTDHVTGSDGCNSINGAYFAGPTSLRFSRFAQTLMYCVDSVYPGLDSKIGTGLSRTRTWAIRDSLLILSDSLGHELLRYGRRVPGPSWIDIVPPNTPQPVIRVVSSIRSDTTGATLAPLWIDSVESTDSGVWLRTVLPDPAALVAVYSLDSIRPSPGWTTLDTLRTDSGITIVPVTTVTSQPLPQELLVTSYDPFDDIRLGIQTPALVFIPWNAIQSYVRIRGTGGGDATFLKPGVFLY